MATAALQCLLCQVGANYLAIPISHVVEVTRPLPITRLPDCPSWVAGVSVLRGIATPVVDARKLIEADDSAADGGQGRASAVEAGAKLAARWVALRVDDRRIALAVDAVLRAHVLPAETQREVPALLTSTPAIAALGALDTKLLMVLEGARLLAKDAVARLEGYVPGA